MSLSIPDFEIRPPRSFDELDAIVQLQQNVWGYGDLDVEGRSILVVADRFSGQVLSAYTPQGELAGFSLAFAALEPGHIHSHRVGILPQWQNIGLGRAIKLAQREHALRAGFHVMHWTYDPMQARNAWFNLGRLGGICRRYIHNLYGITSSPLHGGLPTDRLLVEWELSSERVHRVLAGELPAPAAGALRLPLPPEQDRKIPSVHAAFRSVFQQTLDEGYTVTGFDRENQTYLLERL